MLLAVADQQEWSNDLHAREHNDSSPLLAKLLPRPAEEGHRHQDDSRNPHAGKHYHGWIKFAHRNLDEQVRNAPEHRDRHEQQPALTAHNSSYIICHLDIIWPPAGAGLPRPPPIGPPSNVVRLPAEFAKPE